MRRYLFISHLPHCYASPAAFVGYIVWISVLAMLWVCIFSIAAGPIIFLRLDLWPPLRACFPCSFPRGCCGNTTTSHPLPNVIKLQAARLKEGLIVVLMSALRLCYLAMMVAIAFNTNAPTFACVEFSFNRQNQPSATAADGLSSAANTPYTNPVFELIQALFYPVFLLGVFGRQDWFDAETRHMGLVVHTERSRRDIIYCSVLRRIFSLLAVGFILALCVVLIVVLAAGVSVDRSPLRAMTRGAQVFTLILV